MFDSMRRSRQALPDKECEKILKEGTSGVLALAGTEGFPYAVPMSYVYDGKRLYFHCAKSGHKLDLIRQNAAASFCVIGQDRVVSEAYTTHYKSVIAFGRIRILEEEKEKYQAIEKLALKYAPNDTAQRRKEAIERDWEPLCMLEMTLEHVTGKQASELAKQHEVQQEIGTP